MEILINVDIMLMKWLNIRIIVIYERNYHVLLSHSHVGVIQLGLLATPLRILLPFLLSWDVDKIQVK